MEVEGDLYVRPRQVYKYSDDYLDYLEYLKIDEQGNILNEAENSVGQKKDDDEGDESYSLWLSETCLKD